MSATRKQHPPSLLLGVLDAVTAVTSLTLRFTVVYFLRWLPLGPRFLPTIYANAAAYFSSFALQVWCKPASKKESSRVWALAFGWFDPGHSIATAVSFSINVALLLATWDFIYRGHVLYANHDLSFSRVGYVDASSARIAMRSPAAAAHDIRVEWQEVDTPRWDTLLVTNVSAESDFSATALIAPLKSDTRYLYRTDAGHQGSFHTAKKRPQAFTIVTSSCIKPFFPYSPLDHPLRIGGLEHLSSFVRSRAVDFMLFLGDFIYIDLPHNFGWSTSHYWTAYRQVYASPSWSPELRALPFVHMYDDHEIVNDWNANNTGLYVDAIPAFEHYHQHANPPSLHAGVTYFTFNHGDVAFFVLDTRRFRSGPEVTDAAQRTMLGARQLHDLTTWLRTERRWKVVVSGVPFTRNWRGLPDERDSWAAYLHERQQLLEVMWQTEGVVIVSGDRHEHATTLFPSPDGKRNVIEFSTSPLSQFYQPFKRSYEQVEDTDVKVFSYPFGVSKFGVMAFDTSVQGQMKLAFELVVDGRKVWEYEWRLSR